MYNSDTLTPPEMNFAEHVVEYLKLLSDEKRYNFIRHILEYYCEWCGYDHSNDLKKCQCENDE